MKSITQKKNLILITLILSFFILLLFTTCLFLFLFLSKSGSTPQNQETEHLLYQQISFDDKTTEYGTTTLPRTAFQDDYLSYSSNKHLILINRFGGKEYRCSGTCKCTPKTERRSSSSMFLSRTFVFVLSAVSSTLAYRMASDSIREYCLMEKTECDEEKGSVDISVEECNENSWDDEPSDELDFDTEKFSCVGYCVPTETEDPLIQEQQARLGGCEGLETSGMVVFEEGRRKGKRGEELKGLVKEEFVGKYLDDFCLMMGDVVVDFGKDRREIVCVSRDLRKKGVEGLDNVKCYPVHT